MIVKEIEKGNNLLIGFAPLPCYIFGLWVVGLALVLQMKDFTYYRGWWGLSIVVLFFDSFGAARIACLIKFRGAGKIERGLLQRNHFYFDGVRIERFLLDCLVTFFGMGALRAMGKLKVGLQLVKLYLDRFEFDRLEEGLRNEIQGFCTQE